MLLTRKQLYNATQNHQYLAIRWHDGDVTGVNGRIALFASNKYPIDDTETNIESYYPISFHEYIRIKTPFKK